MKESTIKLLKNFGLVALNGIVYTLATRSTHMAMNLFANRKKDTTPPPESAPFPSQTETVQPDPVVSDAWEPKPVQTYSDVEDFILNSSDSDWFANLKLNQKDYERWHMIVCSIKEFKYDDLTVDVFQRDESTVTIDLIQDGDKVESYFFSV